MSEYPLWSGIIDGQGQISANPKLYQTLMASPGIMEGSPASNDYRLAANGSATNWHGGAYDDFRRSDNIEDRRAQTNYRSVSMWAEEAERIQRQRDAAASASELDRLIRQGAAPFPAPEQ